MDSSATMVQAYWPVFLDSIHCHAEQQIDNADIDNAPVMYIPSVQAAFMELTSIKVYSMC